MITDGGFSIWPIETSRELPSTAQIDGFDVSDAQFPYRGWLPKNVRLHVQDVFAPFPAEHLNAYDIVHIRYFFTLLNPENVEGLVRNLMTLLSMFNACT